MTISLNGDSTVPQPQEVNEAKPQANIDLETFAGDRRRNKVGERYRVELVWKSLTAAEYLTLFNIFQDVVRFSNDASWYGDGQLDVDAMPTYDEDKYQGGATVKRPFKVVLEEVSNLFYLSTEAGDTIITEAGDILVTE